MAAPPLYRRLLGDRFEALPEVLRRFHDRPGGGRARGTLEVKWGQGWLVSQLASALSLPDPGEAVPVTLDVIVEGERERWVRHFNDRRVETVQWERDGWLMEALGRTTFASALVLDGPCLRYEFLHAWQAGLPLPRRLSPVVEGSATGRDEGWELAVRIAAPIVGDLVGYRGWIEPA